MKKRKRSYKYFFKYMGILFPVLLLIIFLVSVLLPDRSFSEKENRVLSSSPRMSLSSLASGQFSKKYETYVNDQFPLRDMWMGLKASTDRILGKTESNGVYLGKDGYLIEDFVPPLPENLERTTNAMTAFAKNHPDLKHYALIAPNSVNILRELLPAAAPVSDQNLYLDELNVTLEQGSITPIDVRESLTSHKEHQLYYRTDHHWTTQAAYFAYLTAAEEMNLNSGAYSYDKVPVTGSFQGTLSAKSGFRSGKKEEISVFLPTDDTLSSVVNYADQQKKTASFYATEQLKGRDKYAMFFNGNHPVVKITTPVEENRTLLVLKDSYANCLVPFLTPHYRTIVMVDPRYYFDDLEKLIQVENIQEVLYLYNANTFFSDTSLEMTLAPQ